nr:hypothetical protein [Tanacetum cinerariifolium]
MISAIHLEEGNTIGCHLAICVHLLSKILDKGTWDVEVRCRDGFGTVGCTRVAWGRRVNSIRIGRENSLGWLGAGYRFGRFAILVHVPTDHVRTGCKLPGVYSSATILVCGGAQYGAFNDMNTSVPAQSSCGRIKATAKNPVWEMEDMPVGRIMANLLPDGRILVAGSNTHAYYNFSTKFPTELKMEAFSPKYLSPWYKMMRPTIEELPEKINYGDTFFFLNGNINYGDTFDIDVTGVLPMVFGYPETRVFGSTGRKCCTTGVLYGLCCKGWCTKRGKIDSPFTLLLTIVVAFGGRGVWWWWVSMLMGLQSWMSSLVEVNGGVLVELVGE